MSAGTTSTDRPATVTARPAVSIERARAAWATAPRDSELDRWRELYALAVPGPGPAGPGRRPEAGGLPAGVPA